MRAKLAALFLLAVWPTLADDAKVACNLDAAAVIVCASGGKSYRVIREAISRTGRHAIAWTVADPKDNYRIETRDGEQFAPDIAIENALLHLPDGAVLKTLPGGHFGDAQRYNHRRHFADWSEFDQWLVVVNDSKWESDDAGAYFIDDDGVSVMGPFDLLSFCAEAVHKFFASGKRFDWDGYLNSLAVKDVTLDGDVALVFTTQIPKGTGKNDFLQFDIVLHMKREKDALTATVKSIKPHPS